MAIYVLGDVHNSLQKLEKILNRIQLKIRDHVIFLGDLLDRNGYDPDPVGVYFMLCGLSAKVTWIRRYWLPKTC